MDNSELQESIGSLNQYPRLIDSNPEEKIHNTNILPTELYKNNSSNEIGFGECSYEKNTSSFEQNENLNSNDNKFINEIVQDESETELPIVRYKRVPAKLKDIAKIIIQTPLPNFHFNFYHKKDTLEDLNVPIFGPIIPENQVKIQPDDFDFFKHLLNDQSQKLLK